MNTGIIRKVDDVGRIVLPIGIRRNLEISRGHPMEFFIDDEGIVLKKHQSSCAFCDNADDLLSFKGRTVCWECLDEAQKKHHPH